jgi:hypothetical protein
MPIDNASPIGEELIHLRDRWTGQGLIVNPGASIQALDDFEVAHRLTLPDELRRYLQLMNGLTGHDQEHFSFWPLVKMCTVAERYGTDAAVENPDETIIFADFLVSSIEYAIGRAAGPQPTATVYALALPRVVEVGDSLFHFFRRYLAQDTMLENPG